MARQIYYKRKTQTKMKRQRIKYTIIAIIVFVLAAGIGFLFWGNGSERDSSIQQSAKLVKFTNEDSLYIEYPYLNADDEVSRYINEQIYHMIFSQDMLEDDGYADRAEIKYEVTYMDDRIISIHFTGYRGKGMDYDDFDIGINFDLSNGEILCLADFYSLKEIRELLENAVREEKLSILEIPLNESECNEYIKTFLTEFETDSYINETNNFYFKENKIVLLANPYPSMKQMVCLELGVDALPVRFVFDGSISYR